MRILLLHMMMYKGRVNKNLKEGGEKSEMLEITHDDDDDDGCET